MRMDRREGLDFLKPILEKTLMKRSFRNGVGTGMKHFLSKSKIMTKCAKDSGN